MLLEACRSFQFCRQITWFLGNNRALSKFRYRNLVIYIIAKKKTNYQVTPFLNNKNFLDSTCSLSDGHLSVIIDASMLCLTRLIDEVGRRTFQVNE